MMLGGWTWTPANRWERRKKAETETQEEVTESEESNSLGYHSSKAGSKESKEG